MRYMNKASFLKAIRASAPNHLSRIYLVAIPDDFERSQVIDEIIRIIGKDPARFSGSGLNLGALHEHLSTVSLFGGEPIAVVDEAEKIIKASLPQVPTILHAGYLILGAKAKTPLAGAVEKEGVALDLLEEKPWDKEKRLVEEVQKLVVNAGKRITPDATALLFERIEKDAAILKTEIEKLICYAAESDQITSTDVMAIVSANRNHTFWQAAEEIVWERKQPALVLDDATFHPIVPILRAQLQLGLKIATLLETDTAKEQWGQVIGKIYPKTLEKRTVQAAQLHSTYFRQGLKYLFEIELLSRTQTTAYGALLDLFRLQLMTYAPR